MPAIPSVVSRQARNVGPVRVPLYLAPWTIPASTSIYNPYFDEWSQFPLIQIPDTHLILNSAPWDFQLIMPQPVASFATVLRPTDHSVGTLVGSWSPTFYASWFGYAGNLYHPGAVFNLDLNVIQTIYGLNVVYPYTPTQALRSPNFNASGGAVYIGKPQIVAYNGDLWFGVYSQNLNQWDLLLYSPQRGQVAVVPNYFSPLAISATHYFISATIPDGLYNNYIYSIKNNPFTTYQSIYSSATNIIYSLSLEDATLNAIFQASTPNNASQPGQQHVAVTPRGFLLLYGGTPRTHGDYTQQCCAIIISPDGTEYAEIIFVPEVSAAQHYVQTGGVWSIAIDPLGVLYLTNGYDRTRAVISWAFNIPFQSPTISFPAIQPISMPCYNPCAAIPIGV